MALGDGITQLLMLGLRGRFRDQPVEKFNANMRDVNSGDTIALDFYDDRVDVLINAINVVSIKGNAFQ